MCLLLFWPIHCVNSLYAHIFDDDNSEIFSFFISTFSERQPFREFGMVFYFFFLIAHCECIQSICEANKNKLREKLEDENGTKK